jgi:hypothetical protein
VHERQQDRIFVSTYTEVCLDLIATKVQKLQVKFKCKVSASTVVKESHGFQAQFLCNYWNTVNEFIPKLAAVEENSIDKSKTYKSMWVSNSLIDMGHFNPAAF